MDQADYELSVLRQARTEIAVERANITFARDELEERFRAEDEGMEPEESLSGSVQAAEAPDSGDADMASEDGDETGSMASAPAPPSKSGAKPVARSSGENSEDEEIDFEESEGEAAIPKIPSARQADIMAAQRQKQVDEKARKAERALLDRKSVV
jgi:hypothetical protein